jgi:hypothetical protein
MKKVSIFSIITLGILAIIALEGRALRQLRKEHSGANPELVPFYLLCVGYEWVLPADTKPYSHHSEI